MAQDNKGKSAAVDRLDLLLTAAEDARRENTVQYTYKTVKESREERKRTMGWMEAVRVRGMQQYNDEQVEMEYLLRECDRT